jgi:hypothetical protein
MYYVIGRHRVEQLGKACSRAFVALSGFELLSLISYSHLESLYLHCLVVLGGK